MIKNKTGSSIDQGVLFESSLPKYVPTLFSRATNAMSYDLDEMRYDKAVIGKTTKLFIYLFVVYLLSLASVLFTLYQNNAFSKILECIFGFLSILVMIAVYSLEVQVSNFGMIKKPRRK